MVSQTEPGKLFPLCETDYFRRLDLLCVKCGRALRGSYITALGAKYHVEHFTCSVCPTVFGPDDSYYEHDGRVYCHYHYSTRFAIQCTGCNIAILKQFVEINRNNADEHWHPECYMIHRYWKIKLGQSSGATARDDTDEPLRMPGALSLSSEPFSSPSCNPENLSVDVLRLEAKETPASLLEQQRVMEVRVFTIWRVLSAFEESSAACISDMLRHVSNGKYLGGVMHAGRFVLHVEVLFSAIDELEVQFQQAQAKPIQYVREARMLCKKIVNFFSLFSHAQETGAQRMGITQELLSLVTGLAHYLKILIRISLTGALRLDQEYGKPGALDAFLGKLDELVMQLQQAPSVGEVHDVDTDTIHGYSSLPHIRMAPGLSAPEAASDLCAQCGHTVEEECVRAGIPSRWHWGCVRCAKCQRGLLKPDGQAAAPPRHAEQVYSDVPNPVKVSALRYRTMRRTHSEHSKHGSTAYYAYCTTCTPADAKSHFVQVTRLEQYAFLLCVALNRLHTLLMKRHGEPSDPQATSRLSVASSESAELTAQESSTYRKSVEMKRIESMYLDRHTSSKAKIPHFSTVVGSPSAYRTAQANDKEHDAFRDTVPNPWGNVHTPGSIVPIRAPFTRHNSDVLVREDGQKDTASESHLSLRHSTDEGITLADIPMILQAEQDRVQRGEPVERKAERTPISALAPEALYVLKHLALLYLQKSPLAAHVAEDDLLELVEVRKNTLWGKLFKPNNRRDVRKKGTFGISLEWLVERSGADSTLGATPAPMRVPSIVDDIVSAMRQMDVSVEGIFRKNGNVRRLKDLAEQLDRETDAANLLDDNPVQLAALLKKFFRELPDPLMTVRLYRTFIAAQQIEEEAERHRLLQYVALLMPKAHRDTMEVLFVFLRWVASFSYVDEETGSRMDLPNLATVMCPNILYTRSAEVTRGDAVVANRVVCHLLAHQDDFWVVPKEMEPILQDRALISAAQDLGAQELMKRCQAYAK
ncbi:Rho-type GTPase activating protein Rga1 [Malassezia vespertilionis]|nr:Rho-type GTPase activating protein Rga1 [Malassezia vespertilionis]WFD08158.1 Rho-type GTPase activating protein Rga1 [Malassezia vespertilionis]